MASTSLPLNDDGHDAAWIGVGLVYLNSLIEDRKLSFMGTNEKSINNSKFPFDILISFDFR